MQGIFPHKVFDEDPDLEFTSDEHGTVITKRVFTSEILQSLLEDKIKWTTLDFAKI